MDKGAIEIEQENAREIERLRWRSRRGLLETDVLLHRFLERYRASLKAEDWVIYGELLALDDPALLDHVLGRRSSVPRWDDLLKKIGQCDRVGEGECQ